MSQSICPFAIRLSASSHWQFIGSPLPSSSQVCPRSTSHVFEYDAQSDKSNGEKLGDDDGMLDGKSLATCDGDNDGVLDGDMLGTNVGNRLGNDDGVILGVLLGSNDGKMLGMALGAEVGDTLGAPDGGAVGLKLGA